MENIKKILKSINVDYFEKPRDYCLQYVFTKLNSIAPICHYIDFCNSITDIELIYNKMLNIIIDNEYELVNEEFSYKSIKLNDLTMSSIRTINAGICYFKKNNIYLMFKIDIYGLTFFVDKTFSNSNCIDNIITYLDDIIKNQKKSNKIWILSHSFGGYSRNSYLIDDEKIGNLEKYYNDELVDIDKKIKSHLNNNDSGLIILHGLQGSGKTSYIRSLINDVDKEFCYLPSNIINILSEPDFVEYVRHEMKNCVIIVEDCENLLKDRKNNSIMSEGIVNILNMSDGLLGDNMNITFICTFNNDYSSIDKALTRKGRLVCKYEFKELCLEKTNSLLKELYGEGTKSDKPLPLCDIFNFNVENNGQTERSRIGF